jgi:hypothetical protein
MSQITKALDLADDASEKDIACAIAQIIKDRDYARASADRLQGQLSERGKLAEKKSPPTAKELAAWIAEYKAMYPGLAKGVAETHARKHFGIAAAE